MVDHHVDRPGVEAQQCVKLTGTNLSIGLIHARRVVGRDNHRPLRVVGRKGGRLNVTRSGKHPRANEYRHGYTSR